MPSPFPGMDPYIERPEIWPDFHDRLITFIQEALQPQLRPRYVALGQDRLFVVESDRPIHRDLAVIRTSSPKPAAGGAATLEADAPAVFELRREKIRQPYIEIVEPAAGNRVVTAIEVLSPDNKAAGEGRASYRRKREEYRAGGANLVEIDLLRAGRPTVQVSQRRLAALRPWYYLVAVRRRRPSRQEIYAVPLARRLPRVAVPLAEGDSDVVLDLQAAFTRCWDVGPYPELLQYDNAPPGRLTPEDVRWCEDLLRQAGLRPAPPT
ncbi:MAG TPA: DUF4058 family protein [Gemmataceae bacterium]|nr:DUF4058 family protein [Gemmataceae bacterium]